MTGISNAHAHAVHAVHTHIVHAVHAHAVHAVHAHAVHAVNAHAVHAHAGVVLRCSCDSVLCICSSSGGVCEQSSSTCSVLSQACASLLGLQGLLLFTLLMLTQALFSDAAATASYVDALAVVKFVSSPRDPAQFSHKLVLACWDFKASCCSRCSC